MTTSTLTPKDWRNRLFKTSRPLIRKHSPEDNKFLWAAYKNGSFDLPEGLPQENFLLAMAQKFGAFNLLWVIEDDNRSFKAGRGLVALIGIRSDGWLFQPTTFFFQWATPLNRLRSFVGFLQMVRHSKEIGACKIETPHNLDRLKKYGVLYLRGRIPFGHPAGDLRVYSIGGKKA